MKPSLELHKKRIVIVDAGAYERIDLPEILIDSTFLEKPTVQIGENHLPASTGRLRRSG
jgi:hypothetical protein